VLQYWLTPIYNKNVTIAGWHKGQKTV